MKLRIVKKQNPGFDVFYELQKRYFITWGLIAWSADLSVIERTRDSMLEESKQIAINETIWSN